ncbi:Bug family tripartite tricarboxylate transporter substrate binding protein [Roseospira navarrensis]|uniref:Tripartite tricarboxylate transporter substrate binding protein n=1 Tax=Roseospira navarrensis TaxID=140058 RepID=A0A7X1ZDR3_9PROT|nr:tripartite tricarboxylate transporter substrate-binding protein [Roseospira navarrensis]MQX36462.1 tripartite tricarboxylate transporter substrate binding protein [Roseospira navarrensis]
MKSPLKVAAIALAATLMSGPALAQIEKPECVAPAKPGGGFDLTCRIAQQGLAPQLDDPMQVTFMPGGIGAVAINLFATTRTDDPNAIVAFSSGSLLNIATGKFGKWTEDDVRFVGTAGADFGAVVVREDSPYQTLDDLMDAFKEDVKGVVVGAGGSVGSQDWMKAALLLKSIGEEPRAMRYVAFDGGGDAIAGLLGGSIQAYMGDVGEMVPHLGAGQMRILALMSPERLPEPFAEYPTAIELGYDAEWTILRGFYMGKDVSDEAYNAWADAFKAAYETEAFAQIQKEKGLMPLNMAGDELDASVKKRIANLRDVAREAGLIE